MPELTIKVDPPEVPAETYEDPDAPVRSLMPAVSTSGNMEGLADVIKPILKPLAEKALDVGVAFLKAWLKNL